jgi:DNA repair protein RadD
MLRPYQQRAIDDLYKWMIYNKGNPCLVLPTGSGKSHIVAAFCKNAVQSWPDTKIMMLTHVKELIEQNAEKMRQHWPGAPMGIYSAGMRRKQLGEPITFAGIQSIWSKSSRVGHIDICIIDECHLVNHKAIGMYRAFLDALLVINPSMRVVGLTATPYRLGHGLITDKPAIFDDLLDPVTIEELIQKGFLAPLRSKVTNTNYDLSGVHKRGGEFIESELQAAVDTDENNDSVIREVIALAEDRKSWLFFCTGVHHAHAIADSLRREGISAACVTGETPKAEREQILSDFKAGRIKALTNANVLTTGFDAPNIDLIAMLRPTMSASLYVQMAGRGMRLKEHTDHCLVLDFAGVVRTHGPIIAVTPPQRKGEEGRGAGEAPVKVCDNCDELVAISAKECPACGMAFPEPEKAVLKLHNDDIMGVSGTEMVVTGWLWRKHTSKTSGKDMLAVSYYGQLSDPSVTEYLPVTHEGYAGQKAITQLVKIAQGAGATFNGADSLEAWADCLNNGKPPIVINYKRDGKYHRVLTREWNNEAFA